MDEKGKNETGVQRRPSTRQRPLCLPIPLKNPPSPRWRFYNRPSLFHLLSRYSDHSVARIPGLQKLFLTAERSHCAIHPLGALVPVTEGLVPVKNMSEAR